MINPNAVRSTGAAQETQSAHKIKKRGLTTPPPEGVCAYLIFGRLSISRQIRFFHIYSNTVMKAT